MTFVKGTNELLDWIYLEGGPHKDGSIRCRWSEKSIHNAEKRIDGLWCRLLTIDADKGFASETLLESENFTNQAPTAVDTPIQLKFGAATGGPTDDAQIDANGTITINRKISIELRFFVQVNKDNQEIKSHLKASLFKDGVIVGNTISLMVETENGGDDDSVVTFTLPVQLTILQPNVEPGTEYKVYLARDSSGGNNGGLVSEATSSVLKTTHGFQDSPSATVTITKVTF